MRRPGVRIPLPPVSARVAGESGDCRAVALSEGGRFFPCYINAASYDSTSQRLKMAKFFYVYVLQSQRNAERFYTGLTDDFPLRRKHHNSGQVLHTAKWRVWRMKTYVAFSDRSRAAQFERYLKSSSVGLLLKSDFRNNPIVGSKSPLASPDEREIVAL